MNNLKCFIIGLGNIGVGYDFNKKSKRVFYTHAKSIYSLKKFNLVGGCDISKKKEIFFQQLIKNLLLIILMKH